MKSVKKLVIDHVGTSYVEKELIAFPDKFTITRVRAEIRSGAGTTVGLAVRQKSGSVLAQDIALEYDLSSVLDYVEQAVCFAYKRKDTDFGKIYLAVKCDAGSNNTILITLEYEV